MINLMTILMFSGGRDYNFIIIHFPIAVFFRKQLSFSLPDYLLMQFIVICTLKSDVLLFVAHILMFYSSHLFTL